MDRFYLLSPETYPDWRGTDEEGCRAIIKAVSSSVPSIKGGEVQFGKSVIFIRTPETYFAIAKLREQRIASIPVPIQRAWRKHVNRKEVNRLPAIMAELYSVNNKARK